MMVPTEIVVLFGTAILSGIAWLLKLTYDIHGELAALKARCPECQAKPRIVPA